MPAGSRLPDAVRAACAWVAERARHVRIDADRLEAYAGELPEPGRAPGLDPEAHVLEGAREARAAFTICLDAVNFGSGWWPTIRKRPGMSGYFTMATGLRELWRRDGGWPAETLTRLTVADTARVFGQDPAHPLMELYARSLRDVGAHVLAEHGGSFAAVADASKGSAVALAETLAAWDAFADTSTYGGRDVPLFKRAQLTPADLARAGVFDPTDEHELTAFADNLVPHVLRVDGVLCLDEDLERRIDAEELLEHGSEEEVELRACALHAVELMAGASGLSPAEVDFVLWNRGQEPRFKARPRPRARTTAY